MSFRYYKQIHDNVKEYMHKNVHVSKQEKVIEFLGGDPSSSADCQLKLLNLKRVQKLTPS